MKKSINDNLCMSPIPVEVYVVFLINVLFFSLGLQCTNLLLESKQKRFYTVDVDTLKKDCTVHSMTKENQYSKSDCVYHVSYGFTMTELWVDKGCRADFRICFATTEDNSKVMDTTWSTFCNKKEIQITYKMMKYE